LDIDSPALEKLLLMEKIQRSLVAQVWPLHIEVVPEIVGGVAWAANAEVEWVVFVVEAAGVAGAGWSESEVYHGLT
jgi:hypothetical protein